MASGTSKDALRTSLGLPLKGPLLLHAAAWLLVVLYWLVRCRPTWGVLAAGAVAIAVQFFTGHGQIWLYTLVIVLAIWGFLPSKWLFHALPGFGAFPVMARGLLIVDLSLALRSGLALTYLARLPRDTASRLLRRGGVIVLSVAVGAVGMVAVLAMGGEVLHRLYGGPGLDV